MNLKYCLLAVLWPAITSYAQPKPLLVGDILPESLTAKILNYTTPSIKLRNLQSDLIILDFWDTHCLPCIKALPKMDSLQQQFGPQIKIMPVAYESQATIRRFLSENHIGKRLHLPSIVEDTILAKLFPHKIVPHEVWINGKGVVIAITEDHHVNAKTIQAILDGTITRLPLKKELNTFKPDSLIVFNDNGGTTKDLLYNSMITRPLDGGMMGSKGIAFHNGKTTYRALITNLTVRQLYAFAFDVPVANVIVKDVKDKFRYYDVKRLLLTTNPAEYSKWSLNNRYCYDLLMPVPAGIDTLKNAREQNKLLQSAGRKVIQQDLNRFFGNLYGTFGQMQLTTVKCYVLVKMKDVPMPMLTNTSTSHGDTVFIINKLSGNLRQVLTNAFSYTQDMIFVDETGLGDKRLNIYLARESLTDLEHARKDLQRYGLDIIEAERQLNTLVISENPPAR